MSQRPRPESLESEERYRLIFKHSPLGIIHFDPNGVVLDCNEHFLEIMGASREKVIGFNMVDSIGDEAMREAVLSGLSGKGGYYDGDYLSATGEKLTPVRAIYNRIEAEDGTSWGAVGIFEDKTEQKRAEAEIAQYRNHLEQLVEERTRELAQYRKRLEILVAERTTELRKTNQLLELEMSERKRAGAALERAYRNLRDIVDFLPDATFVIDQDRKVITWNRAMEEMTGIKKEEMLGKGDYAYAVPFYGGERPLLIDMVMDPEIGGEGAYACLERMENRITAEAFAEAMNDGRGAHLWGTASLLFDMDGKVIGAIQSIRDISERKMAQEALRLSEERFRVIFESAQECIYLKDRSSRYTLVNPAMERTFGLPASKIIGRTAHGLFGEDYGKKALEHDLRVFAGEIVESENIRPVCGSFRIFHVIKVPIRSQAGEIVGLCAIARDITERKKAEEELDRHRGHLEELVRERTTELELTNALLTHEVKERKRTEEALKLFAYSVAHDLKSPTVGIHGLTRRLHKHNRDTFDEKSKIYCDQILKISEHIAALVEKVNLYIAAKEARLQVERVKLEDLLELLRNEFSSHLNNRSVTLVEPPAGIEFNADRLALIRALGNLIDNALKYGGDKLKTIWIEHEETPEHVILSVSNDGKPLEPQESIFAPFKRNASSKGIEGAGLGLAIVKEIADQHGGRAWCEPGPGKLTRFRLSLSKRLQAGAEGK